MSEYMSTCVCVCDSEHMSVCACVCMSVLVCECIVFACVYA